MRLEIGCLIIDGLHGSPAWSAEFHAALQQEVTRCFGDVHVETPLRTSRSYSARRIALQPDGLVLTENASPADMAAAVATRLAGALVGSASSDQRRPPPIGRR
jgi:hypothetical protein